MLKHFLRCTTGLVLFEYASDMLSVRRLLSQIFQGPKSYFFESYRHTIKAFGGYVYVPVARCSPEDNFPRQIRNFLSCPKTIGVYSQVFRKDNNVIFEVKTPKLRHLLN